MKKIVDSAGRDLYIIDDLFSQSYHHYLYAFAKGFNKYSLGFEDTDAIERLSHKYYTANIGVEELQQIQLFSQIQKTELHDLIKEKQLIRATINTSVPSQTNFAHTHFNQWSLIYYMNIDWKNEWAGETLFYNDNLSEIEFASIYKPNRAIFFDGHIPHSLRTQSINAPHYRFSLAMFFEKK